VEKLIVHYENTKISYLDSLKNISYNYSVVNVLKTEDFKERLIDYIEKHPSYDIIMNYYHVFAKDFPEKTLILFRQIVDKYTDNNTGEESYKNVASALKSIASIKGGKSVVDDMIKQFKIRHKRRWLMFEVILGNRRA